MLNRHEGASVVNARHSSGRPPSMPRTAGRKSCLSMAPANSHTSRVHAPSRLEFNCHCKTSQVVCCAFHWSYAELSSRASRKRSAQRYGALQSALPTPPVSSFATRSAARLKSLSDVLKASDNATGCRGVGTRLTARRMRFASATKPSTAMRLSRVERGFRLCSGPHVRRCSQARGSPTHRARPAGPTSSSDKNVSHRRTWSML